MSKFMLLKLLFFFALTVTVTDGFSTQIALSLGATETGSVPIFLSRFMSMVNACLLLTFLQVIGLIVLDRLVFKYQFTERLTKQVFIQPSSTAKLCLLLGVCFLFVTTFISHLDATVNNFVVLGELM